MQTQTRTVAAMLRAPLFSAIDEAARSEDLSLSEFVRLAVIREVERRGIELPKAATAIRYPTGRPRFDEALAA